MKLTGYVIGPVLAVFILGSYVCSGIQRGEWNLRTQMQTNMQRNDERKIKEKKQMDLMEKVFGENGLTDVNKDGKISLNEMADAYTRTGLEERGLEVLDKAKNYSHASLDDLEKAVKSYAEK